MKMSKEETRMNKGENMEKGGAVSRFKKFSRTHTKTTIGLVIFLLFVIYCVNFWIKTAPYRAGMVIEKIPQVLGTESAN